MAVAAAADDACKTNSAIANHLTALKLAWINRHALASAPVMSGGGTRYPPGLTKTAIASAVCAANDAETAKA